MGKKKKKTPLFFTLLSLFGFNTDKPDTNGKSTPIRDFEIFSIFLPFLFTMPFTSDRKNIIREVEMTFLCADNDDDDETVNELAGLHNLISCSRL